LISKGLCGTDKNIKNLASGFYQRRFKKIAMGEAGIQAMVDFNMEKEENKLDGLIIRMYKKLNDNK
jgi:hypothetical protein